jgi:hypothetical protein
MVIGWKFGHREGPPWLAELLSIREFFGHCTTHVTGRNEKNHFCFDCKKGPLCPVGVAESHAGHATVQIRKASHRDVVRVVDIYKLLDFSNIQLYTINSAKILFLQSRPQQKLAKGVPYYCHTCQRSIADPVRFCSLLCKLTAIRENAHDFTISLTLQAGSSKPEGLSGSSDGIEGGNPPLPDFYPSTPKAKAAKARKLVAHRNDYSVSKRRKKKIFKGMGLENSGPLSSSSSPYSLLMPDPEQQQLELSEFQQQVFLMNSSTLVGPSTPKGMESLTARVRQRKQVHPHRAPLF